MGDDGSNVHQMITRGKSGGGTGAARSPSGPRRFMVSDASPGPWGGARWPASVHPDPGNVFTFRLDVFSFGPDIAECVQFFRRRVHCLGSRRVESQRGRTAGWKVFTRIGAMCPVFDGMCPVSDGMCPPNGRMCPVLTAMCPLPGSVAGGGAAGDAGSGRPQGQRKRVPTRGTPTGWNGHGYLQGAQGPGAHKGHPYGIWGAAFT